MVKTIAIISFTGQGSVLCSSLKQRMERAGYLCRGYVQKRFLNHLMETGGMLPVSSSLGEWAKEQFAVSDALVFIGAAGIAVRAVAPYLEDKMKDPAVLVLDERGQFVIPILSGHVGGANELARQIARFTGAVPVITTATDVNRLFAVDEFAVSRGLAIGDRRMAKRISADLLEGIPVGFFSDFPVKGGIPEGCTQKETCSGNIWVTVKDGAVDHGSLSTCLNADSEFLPLIPKIAAVGIGCRKGTDMAVLEQAVLNTFKHFQIRPEAIKRLASIDLKKAEDGIIQLAVKYGWEFVTYTKEELSLVPGAFTESNFVQGVTGVGNVCERAAVLGSGLGQLAIKKQAGSGVAIAVAMEAWSLVTQPGSGQDK